MSVLREPDLILASQSPRRAALLTAADYAFQVICPDPRAEGEPHENESARELVLRLATSKALDVARRCWAGGEPLIANKPALAEWVLAADTVAECNGQILGKPRDREDAQRILKFLADQEHRVWTGVCLVHLPSHRMRAEVDVTRLQMAALADRELEQYLDSGRWQGKAGAFGYQDGNDWVQIIEGSASNVVGLPLERLARMFAAMRRGEGEATTR